MNTGNLVVLTLVYTGALMIVQRAERKHRLIVALIALVPIGYMTYQWGILREQMPVVLWSAGIALGLNLLFWLLWGRRHPAGTSDSIKVMGMED